MVHYEEYRRAAQLLEVLQTLSVFRRSESLVFRDENREIVGRLGMAAGRVCFGVELDRKVYVDQIFREEAPQYALALEASLAGEECTEAQAELLQQPSLGDHVALCALTGRAIRCLAARCFPDALTILPPQSRSLLTAPSFAPSELLLAAGRQGELALDDLAVRMYGTPPALVQERWLFEMQPAAERHLLSWPWPVMTTRIATRRIEDIALFGQLAQQLIPREQERRSAIAVPSVQARVLRLDRRLLFQICTADYVAILIYDIAQLEVVLQALDELVKSGPQGLDRRLAAEATPTLELPELEPAAAPEPRLSAAPHAACLSQTVSIVDAEIPLAPPAGPLTGKRISDTNLAVIGPREPDPAVAQHALDGGVRTRALSYAEPRRSFISRPTAAARSTADVRR